MVGSKRTRTVMVVVMLLAGCSGGDRPAVKNAIVGAGSPQAERQLTWGNEQEMPNHSHTLQDAMAVAQRFSVITAVPEAYAPYVGLMKARNPELQLFVYVNGIADATPNGGSRPEAWYVKDRVGNRVRTNFGFDLMDPAHPDWVADRVAVCRSALARSHYDGCFLDNLGVGSLHVPGSSGVPIDPRRNQEWQKKDWLDATSDLASTVQSQLGVPLVVNGLISGSAYFDPTVPSRELLDTAGRALAEAFVRGANDPSGVYRSEAAWKADVDMLADAAARHRQVLALTKVWSKASRAEKDSWHRYALATFLLGSDGTSRFAFSSGRHSDTLASIPLNRVSLGAPLGRYAKVHGAYERSFANGKVIVNPAESSVRVKLDHPHVDLDGTTRLEFTLPPHDALILRLPG